MGLAEFNGNTEVTIYVSLYDCYSKQLRMQYCFSTGGTCPIDGTW
jgi:hypothetical protein